jgi:hypothetical protein
MAGIKIRGYAGAFSESQEEAILSRIQDRLDAIVDNRIGNYSEFETVPNLRSLRSKIKAANLDFDLAETDYLMKQFEQLRELELLKRKGVDSRSKEYDLFTSAAARYKDAIKKIAFY